MADAGFEVHTQRGAVLITRLVLGWLTRLDGPLWGTPTGVGAHVETWMGMLLRVRASEASLAAPTLGGWALAGYASCLLPSLVRRCHGQRDLKQTGTRAQDGMRRVKGRSVVRPCCRTLVVNPPTKLRNTHRRRPFDRICRASPWSVARPDPGVLLSVWFPLVVACRRCLAFIGVAPASHAETGGSIKCPMQRSRPKMMSAFKGSPINEDCNRAAKLPELA